jgi:hypothetical protein
METQMTDRDRGVPRGDNVPAEEREQNEERSEHRAEPGEDSAAERGHGAHGRGVLGREQHRDEVDVKPDGAEGGPRGSAAWGSEPSGGSVVDKR